MAAVTGNLEREGEFEDIEAGPAFSGLGALGAIRTGPANLATTHTSLLRTHWVRNAAERFLAQCTFRHEWDGSNLIIRLTKSPVMNGKKPIFPQDAVPFARGGSEVNRLYVWSEDNSKMNCPVFDLPAGASAVGGTCPGANAGQTVVPDNVRAASIARVTQQGVPSIGLPKGASLPVLKEVKPASTICQSCVPGDTLIMVRGEGLRRIDEMLGRCFEVWSGLDWRETHVIEKGVKPTLTLRTRNGVELRATADHRILTSEGWVEAGSLEPGDLLPYALPNAAPFPHQASTGLHDGVLDAPYRTEKRGKLPAEWTYDLGVFLGYMVGDGSFNTAREYPTAALVAAEHDRSDLDRLAHIVGAWTGSEAEVHVRASPPSGLTQNASSHAHLHWRSKSVTHILVSMGLEKRGPDTVTPKAVWSASTEGVAGYLSGLFSTDGSVGMSNGAVELSFSNTSRTLVREVQQLLMAFGIRTSFTEYRNNADRGYERLWKLGIKSIESVRRFAQAIGFFNARKQALLTQALETSKERAGRDTRMVVDEVVDSNREEMVYDLLNVGDEHQFLANGLVIHNCYAEGGSYAYSDNAARLSIRYWWALAMVNKHYDEFVRVLVASALKLKYPAGAPGGILPIRLHSSGDFFSIPYAKAWMEVADRLAVDGGEVGKRLRFWAPTRTWATPEGRDGAGWRSFWETELPRMKSQNFMVRASGYHFNEPAPGALAEGNALGSTSMYITDKEAALARRDFRATPAEKPFFDWMCPTYAQLSKDQVNLKNCSSSPNPYGGTHCRACWVAPEMRINYPAH